MVKSSARKLAYGAEYYERNKERIKARRRERWAKPGDSFDASFFEEHKDLTETQIAKAAYRLARVLNNAFDN